MFEAEGKADSFAWLTLPGTSHYRVFNEGRTLVLSSPSPGTYTLILGASVEGSVKLVQWAIDIKGTDPNTLNVADWCRELTLPKDEALALSKSFASVASVIESGAIKSVEDVIKATAQSNRKALGESDERLKAWTPFMKRLADHLDKVKPASVADHAPIWLEIAVQLEQYGKG